MHFSERFRVVGADGQERYLGATKLSDELEAIEICAVPGVVDTAPLMFQNETAVTTVMVPERARAPVIRWSESYFPIAMAEAFPPFEFHDAFESQIMGEIADPPGHHPELRVR